MKNSLRAAAIVLMVSLLLPASVFAAKITWNYSVWGPKRAFTAGIEKAKEMMESASNGDFQLTIHYAGEISPAKENLDGVKIGAFEAAALCLGYHPNKWPLATVLELPFLLTEDLEANAKIEDAVYNHPAVAKELAQRWNARFLILGLLPTYEFMGNTRIAGVKDLEGVRMRISGLNAEVLQMFGARPANVTAAETYDALSRGTIDMIGLPWTYAHAAYKLHEVSDYATLGMAMSGFSCVSVVSRDAWNDLPQNLKDMMPEVRRESTRAMIDAYHAADKRNLPMFRKNLELVPFPANERQKLVAKAGQVWQRWEQEQNGAGRPGTEVLTFAKAKVAEFGK